MTVRRTKMHSLPLAIMLIFAAMACTRQLKEQEFRNPQARIDLLIAGNTSSYKDALRNAIIRKYRGRANIRVVNLDKLGKITAGDYQAILIMDTCHAWTHFNQTVKSFLDRPAAKGRVVWFMTVDDTEEIYRHAGVDAITAASVLTNQESVVARLSRQIDTILEHRP